MLKIRDELMALPLKGESFLLRRGRQHVLVDGGYNSTTLAEELERHVAHVDYIDVVVCTHADSDHAKGLSEFLDKWPTDIRKRKTLPQHNVGEFWLPGRWANVLPDLACRPREFIDNLVDELDKFEDANPDLSELAKADTRHFADLLDKRIMEERAPDAFRENSDSRQSEEYELLWDEFVDEEFVEFRKQDGLPEAEWFSDIKKALEENREYAEKAFSSARSRILYRKRKQKVQEVIALYWLDAVETARNIRSIAEQAARYGVPIRWFDYEGYSKTRKQLGGERNFLIPLNAVEQEPAPRMDLSYLAMLSAVNRECLTFLAPPTISRLGVLFCGDSPMGDGPNYGTSFVTGLRPPRFPVVATAPHHGSESNEIAYSHLASWPVICWLRTGGTKKHPGPTFKNIPFPGRVCTHCPQTGLSRRAASIAQVGEIPWSPIVMCMSGHQCRCV